MADIHTSKPTKQTRKSITGLSLPLSTALALSVSILASCSKSESLSPPVTTGQGADLAEANPCELLTPEEVESIFGEPAGTDAEPTSAGPISSCGFHNEAGGRFFIIQIGPETAIEVDSGDPEVTVVPDLGDEVVYFSGMLRVRVGETVLQVSTWHPRGQQEEALVLAQEIARLALSKLP